MKHPYLPNMFIEEMQNHKIGLSELRKQRVINHINRKLAYKVLINQMWKNHFWRCGSFMRARDRTDSDIKSGLV